MSEIDWLSRLLQTITVTGQLEVRCAYGAPWRVAWPRSAAREIPYHIVLNGHAIIEDPETKTSREFVAGDIALLPHGSAHVLYDGSGQAPVPTYESRRMDRQRERRSRRAADLLCGRFFIGPPHDRLIQGYLPTDLVVRAVDGEGEDADSASSHLASLVRLMRLKSTSDKPGGNAILNALSLALFALVLRAASVSSQAPNGLLALAGHPRLAPAISAMFADPARRWTILALADLCGMSRATFIRHFRAKLGRLAADLLTDIRMSVAANELKKPAMSTEDVADLVGYQSVAAFGRAFTDRIGMTPREWRGHPSVQ